METMKYTPNPVSVANELITLGDLATDESRDATPYLDHAELILNAYEARGSADAEVAAAVAFIAAV